MKSREPRRKVIVRARMRAGTAWGDICIRNLSSRGLMAQAATPPDPGSYVEIRRGRHIVIGRTMWRDGRNFGVRARDRIDMDGIVDETPAPANDSAIDRRTDPSRDAHAHRPSVAARLESSRQFANAFQFLAIGALALAGAVYAASQVHAVLTAPVAKIEGALAGDAGR